MTPGGRAHAAFAKLEHIIDKQYNYEYNLF